MFDLFGETEPGALPSETAFSGPPVGDVLDLHQAALAAAVMSAVIFDAGGGQAAAEADDERLGRRAWTPDGHTVVGAGGKSVAARSAADGELLGRFEFEADVTGFAWSPDGIR